MTGRPPGHARPDPGPRRIATAIRRAAARFLDHLIRTWEDLDDRGTK